MATVIPLSDVSRAKNVKIVSLVGGLGFKRKLYVMGLREGKVVRVVTRQPLRGPITIKIGGCQLTIGKGMAQKVMVEVCE